MGAKVIKEINRDKREVEGLEGSDKELREEIRDSVDKFTGSIDKCSMRMFESEELDRKMGLIQYLKKGSE